MAKTLLKSSSIPRLLRHMRGGSLSIFSGCSSSTSSFPSPEFDWEYLLYDASIETNIQNRKGVGDIRKTRKLISDSQSIAPPETTSLSIPSALNDDLIREVLRIPNATHPDVPVGDEAQSRVVAEFNQRRTYNYAPKNHIEIGTLLKGLRTDNVGPTTGKKSFYLMNDIALLERALVKYAVSKLRHAGFSTISVPDIIRPEVVQRCGFETDIYNNAVYHVRLPRSDGEEEEFCLSGTAEMGIAGFLKGRTFRASDLPLKLASVSRCFRSEKTTRVIDKGLYRVLQFTKVELFCLTRNEVDESEKMLADLLRLQRDIFEPLGICGRVVEMSTQELGAPAYHKYDIEAWIESRDAFSEISSTSNCTDFQSRRLGIRYSDDGV